MTVDEVLAELRRLGAATPPRAPGALGVKVADLKTIVKRVKVDHALALALYDTGLPDAMYLAGLVADDARMSPADLDRWALAAPPGSVRDYTVPWVASGSPHAWAVAAAWIERPEPHVAAAGWATYGCLLSVTDDAALDRALLARLLDRVTATIHAQPGPVRLAMNGFVIGVGGWVPALTDAALAAAARIGRVDADADGARCAVPDAADYIARMRARPPKKRKTAKC